MEQFTGWPPEAFDLLLSFDGEPILADLEPHREAREKLVREPMRALCEDVADDYTGEPYVWSVHRHPMSFQHQWGYFDVAPRVTLAVEIELNGLAVEGAWWKDDTEGIRRYRSAVAAPGSGSEFADIVAELTQRGYTFVGELTKRVPPGFPGDHPRGQLLRYKRMFARREFGFPDWLHTRRPVTEVKAAFRELKPFTDWFNQHVARVH